MTTADVLNSSLNEDWPTNQEWFNEWNEEFCFTLDAAANIVNAKCPKFFTIETDGLKQPWTGNRVFINPPYNNLYYWVKKASDEMQVNHVFSVMFLPARTQNDFFHDFCWDAKRHCPRKGIQLRFLKRMKFADSVGPCPFGLMLIIFNPDLYIKKL